MKKKIKKEITKDENFKDVLLKKAIGYKVEECVCEYGIVEDECRLIKKKVSEKYYPPDLNALQLLLQESVTSFDGMTDEELEQEKQKLIKKLLEGEKNGIERNQSEN